MKIKLIIGFSIAILLAIFALQNAEIVNVKFLFWHLEISRTLLILLSIGMGMLFCFLITLSGSRKKKSKEQNATKSKD